MVTGLIHKDWVHAYFKQNEHVATHLNIWSCRIVENDITEFDITT